MTDTLRDRLGALPTEEIERMLTAAIVMAEMGEIPAKATVSRWRAALLAAQPAPAVMGEGENWWTEAAADVIRHAKTDSSPDWQNAIVGGILRAYNRGHTAAAESREEPKGGVELNTRYGHKPDCVFGLANSGMCSCGKGF